MGGCSGPDPAVGWAPAFDATDTGWLLNVWGPSGDDLRAVGGDPDRGCVVHYDGTSWDVEPMGLDVPLLNWTHGFASGETFVVGNRGTVIELGPEGWRQHGGVPTDQDLWGVWGAAPDDLWAVGGNGRAEGQATILRYDGASWRTVEVPALMRARVWAFFKVWGTASDDLWIVGQRGAVLHWDGSELIEHLVGASDDLISVWGTGPDRVAVVGGRGNAVVATFAGNGWTSRTLAPLPGLNGVWMRDPDVLHVAGIEGTLASVDFETLAYTEEPSGTRQTFHSVFGDDRGRLTAVGGSLASPVAPFEGVAYARALGEGE